jgi:F-type H+-transporting ATPase subunit b
MRGKKLRLLLLALLAIGLVLGLAGRASAQEGEGEGSESEDDAVHHVEEIAEENGASEEDTHCVATIAEGGSVDDCQEAPSPLIPEWNEVIWGGIAFAIVFFFLAKFGLPQMKATMDARTERIRGDIAAAESQREEADQVLAEYRAQLNDARSEAGRIIEEARQAADAIKSDQEARLQTELAELRQRAVADIDSAKAQAMTDLRSEVASLAVGAAETIVGRSLDADTQSRLVDEYIDQLAQRSS